MQLSKIHSGALAAAIAILPVPPAGALTTTEIGYRPNAVICIQGELIAVDGTNNTEARSAYSKNALDWHSNSMPTETSGLLDLAHGDGWTVAVGWEGTVVRSQDNRNWTREDPGIVGSTNRPQSVAFGDGSFIMVGAGFEGNVDGNLVMRSSDKGSTWEVLDLNGQGETWLNGIYFRNGTFTIVGDLGAVLQSTDGGDSWIRQPGPPRQIELQDVAFGAGRYVASGRDRASFTGDMFVSDDGGINWRAAEDFTPPQETFTETFGVKWLGDRFVVAGDNGVYSSPDGDSWTLIDLGSLSGSFTDLAIFKEDIFLAGSSNNSVLFSWQSDDVVFREMFESVCTFQP